MGLLTALTVLFVALKLTGVIAWSWLAVLAPFLCEVGAVLLFFLAAFFLNARK